MVNDLKVLILETAKLHEESGIAKEKTHQGELQMNLSLENAAKQACDDELWYPVWLLLHLGWNDALAWANDAQMYRDSPTVHIAVKN